VTNQPHSRLPARDQLINQSTNQGSAHSTCLKCGGYTTSMSGEETASALAGVEGFQLNPSQGAGEPMSGSPAKGAQPYKTLSTVRRIQYPPRGVQGRSSREQRLPQPLYTSK
jgi:hypothetical protein